MSDAIERLAVAVDMVMLTRANAQNDLVETAVLADALDWLDETGQLLNASAHDYERAAS